MRQGLICWIWIFAMTAGAPLWACPFCEAPTQTYRQLFKDADSVVLVRWKGLPVPEESGLPPVNRCIVTQVLFDKTDSLAAGKEVTIHSPRPGPGEMALLCGTREGTGMQWKSPVEASPAAWTYLAKSPPLAAPRETVLKYVFNWLEHPDPLVAMDAFGEIACAPYEEVRSLAPWMPREKLRMWIAGEETPSRMGLYGMMLGLCGTDADARFLEAKILQLPADADTARMGLDGIIYGYLLLTRDAGLDRLCRAKFQAPAIPRSESFALIHAIRFLWTYGEGSITKEKLRGTFESLLDNADLADIVILDLARWEDWECMDRLVAAYTSGRYHEPELKRLVIRYLMCAERGAEEHPDNPPPHAIAARDHLRTLRARDPAIVASVERNFFD